MIAAALLFACAIVLDAAAFVIWDVGTRPPAVLVRDAGAALHRPPDLARGALRFLAGGALLVLAAFIARPAISSAAAFTVLETGMLIVALVVEALVGTTVRTAAKRGP